MVNEENEKEGTQIEASPKLRKLVDELLGLSVKEALDLSSQLEALGFKPSVQQASVQAAAPTPTETPAEATGKSFNLILKDVGDNKVAAMKLVKDLFSLELSKIKELFASPNPTIATNVSKKDADSHIEKFAAIGAKVVAE